MNGKVWYYADGETRVGPMDLEEIRAAISAGRIRRDTLVWYPGLGLEWKAAGSIADLFPPPDLAHGNIPSASFAAKDALARMKELLFRPFSFLQWVAFACCAWICSLGGPVVFRVSSQPDSPAQNMEQLSAAALKAFQESCTQLVQSFSSVRAFVQTGLAIALYLLLFVWLCWLRNRGEFMLLHKWYVPQDRLFVGWQLSRRPAHSLFLWRIVVYVIALFCILPIFGSLYRNVIVPYVTSGFSSDTLPIHNPQFLYGTLGIVLISVTCFSLQGMATEFVVPVLYWHPELSSLQAWRIVWTFFCCFPGRVFGFYLLQFGLCFLWGGLYLLLFLVLIPFGGLLLFRLPFVSDFLLLPMTLFFRSYSLYFFSSWQPNLVPSKQ
ncbi:MAG: DUF4339 domain-containing protein [Kiritimatiellae bacterium]|nr:DUF4339 domain-containing protein [Kiritimatiellia bacterium]MBR4616067.1 DUF4339 domain-containing protein [Kiritimatiellia bacterium]